MKEVRGFRKSLEAVAFSFVYGHEEDVNKVLLMAEYESGFGTILHENYRQKWYNVPIFSRGKGRL